jgi:serine O-acetyltransferase
MDAIAKAMSRRIADSCEITDVELTIFNRFACDAFTIFKRNHNAQRNKYSEISHWNVDQCIHYYVFLQSLLYDHGHQQLSERVYYYLRTNFNIDIFPSRRLPDNILFVHPLGSILGNARYSNYMVVYQGVTVGGNTKLEYPAIGEDAVFYSGAKVIGNSRIGHNAVIGAGVTINNEEIPDNTVVFLDQNNLRQFKLNKQDNRRKYFQ